MLDGGKGLKSQCDYHQKREGRRKLEWLGPSVVALDEDNGADNLLI
ncbi:hypothetical protein DOT_2914 [Desulfosporosinus sp. OT]|nr:hypothetical protein DOT_2914 [Desulfosporosinus sp. OT]